MFKDLKVEQDSIVSSVIESSSDCNAFACNVISLAVDARYEKMKLQGSLSYPFLFAITIPKTAFNICSNLLFVNYLRSLCLCFNQLFCLVIILIYETNLRAVSSLLNAIYKAIKLPFFLP